MKYDFDTPINRQNTNSLKWDIKNGELPMWVADMDFQTAPEITQAIIERANHGIFGYSIIPDEWNTAYVNWWHRKHNFNINADDLIFCTGIVPAISSIVRKLSTPAENVVIITPVYNIFYNSVLNNGRNILECPLDYDGKEYKLSFEKLEKCLSNPQTSLMIFCNPHNPTGYIWKKDELEKIGELCKKYSVTLISDEIHCDITEPDKEYIPFASVSETCKNISVTCIAPTKAFNIAGLQTAAVFSANPTLHHKVWRGLNTDEVAEPNAFAVNSAIAAFEKGENWLEELKAYISKNKKFVNEFIEKNNLPIHSVKSDATYLMWIDISKVSENSDKFADFVRKNTGLYISAGSQFGGNGCKFIRLNVACPLKTLADGMERLNIGIKKYFESKEADKV